MPRLLNHPVAACGLCTRFLCLLSYAPPSLRSEVALCLIAHKLPLTCRWSRSWRHWFCSLPSRVRSRSLPPASHRAAGSIGNVVLMYGYVAAPALTLDDGEGPGRAGVSTGFALHLFASLLLLLHASCLLVAWRRAKGLGDNSSWRPVPIDRGVQLFES